MFFDLCLPQYRLFAPKPMIARERDGILGSPEDIIGLSNYRATHICSLDSLAGMKTKLTISGQMPNTHLCLVELLRSTIHSCRLAAQTFSFNGEADLLRFRLQSSLILQDLVSTPAVCRQIFRAESLDLGRSGLRIPLELVADRLHLLDQFCPVEMSGEISNVE